MIAELPEDKRLRLQNKGVDRKKPDHGVADEADDAQNRLQGAGIPIKTESSPSVGPVESQCSTSPMTARDRGTKPQEGKSLSEIEGSTHGQVQLSCLGAACDSCRRKHKRCRHRLELDSGYDDQEDFANDVKKKRKGRPPKRGRPAGPSRRAPHSPLKVGSVGHSSSRAQPSPREPLSSDSCAVGETHDQPAMQQSAPVSPVRVNMSNTQANSEKVNRKGRRGYVPRPPNLTKNGKRRGRPPKALSQPRSKVLRSTFPQSPAPANSDSDATPGLSYRPRKRRAIEDYEFSEKFNEIILEKSPLAGASCSGESEDVDDTPTGTPESEVEAQECQGPMWLVQMQSDRHHSDTPASYSKISVASLLNPSKDTNARVQRRDNHRLTSTDILIFEQNQEATMNFQSVSIPPDRILRSKVASGRIKHPGSSQSFFDTSERTSGESKYINRRGLPHGEKENSMSITKVRKSKKQSQARPILRPVTNSLSHIASIQETRCTQQSRFAFTAMPEVQYSSIRTSKLYP